MPSSSQLARALIIVVDQDQLLRDLLIHSLASNKCDVVPASSIAEAKTVIVKRVPSLVIVSAQLPDAVGFIFGLQAAKSQVIALVDSDKMRDQLRRAEIQVVDKRGSLGALVDAIRHTIGLEIDGDIRKSAHVLIVDDEEGIRSFLSEFLTQRGYVTSVARNGREAIEAIRADRSIAVVILDIVMPRQNGLQTLAQIMSRRPHPGVIMMSGLADESIARRALKLGAFGWIVKPPDLREVEATVSACIVCSEMAS